MATYPSLLSVLGETVSEKELWDKTAIETSTTSCTFGELFVRSKLLADELIELGFGSGHVVLAYLGNGPSFMVAMLAATRVGCAFAPLDQGITAEEAASTMSLVGQGLVICNLSNDAQAEVFTDLRVRLDEAGRYISKTDKVDAYSLKKTVSEQTACIQFSSGSTGKSKAIELSKEAFYYRSLYLCQALKLGDKDRTLCCLPLSHTHGAECLALPTLLVGGTLHLVEPKFAFPLYVLEELEKHCITFFSAIPNFYDFAVRLEPEKRPDLSSLRHPFCGSAALSNATAERFFENYGVHIKQGYGLAELSVITVNLNPSECTNYGSIGTPMPGLQWRIQSLDSNDSANDEQEGELYVRSKALFSKYLGNEEATKEKLDDGWMATGDIVRVDANGQFYITGRKEDFIKANGFKLYLSEVEQAIISSTDVKECAVLPRKNQLGQEIMVVAAVPQMDKPEHAAEPLSSAEQSNREARLINTLRQQLSDYKIPRHFEWFDELPKNALGKILKLKIQLAFDRKEVA